MADVASRLTKNWKQNSSHTILSWDQSVLPQKVHWLAKGAVLARDTF